MKFIDDIYCKYDIYNVIKDIYRHTNKLKKVSISVMSHRFCFKGEIVNGILNVFMCKISIDPKAKKILPQIIKGRKND